MQESTKNPSFIPATHFYNDFNVYIMPKEIPENKPKLFDTVSQTHSAHIYTAYFLHIPIILQQFIVNMQILYIFSWCFHIFIVILQPQTNKNTAYESKEQ
jgi:hypothetical protein